ncbi:MAG: RDD family protein [Gammaproteobacteria bacterium]
MSTPNYAGFWIRFVAFIIDSLLITAVIVPIILIFYEPEQLSKNEFAYSPSNFILNYVLPAVAFITFWIYKSSDPGKMVFGIKISDEKTGGKPSNGQMIGRYFGYYVSGILLALGFIWIAFDKRKQGWHDKLAGTLVVRESSTIEDNTEDSFPEQ